MRKITLAFIVTASYLIQTVFNKEISIGNITPNLMIIVICVFGLLRGKKEGLIIGFFSGLLLDIFYGYAGVVGFYSLMYMYTGYAVGFFHEIIYINDIMIPMGFVAVSDIICNFIFYIIAFALRNKLDFGVYFKNIMLPEAIYTVFLSIFLYKLYKVINKKLEKHEKGKEAKYGSRDISDSI